MQPPSHPLPTLQPYPSESASIMIKWLGPAAARLQTHAPHLPANSLCAFMWACFRLEQDLQHTDPNTAAVLASARAACEHFLVERLSHAHEQQFLHAMTDSLAAAPPPSLPSLPSLLAACRAVTGNDHPLAQGTLPYPLQAALVTALARTPAQPRQVMAAVGVLVRGRAQLDLQLQGLLWGAIAPLLEAYRYHTCNQIQGSQEVAMHSSKRALRVGTGQQHKAAAIAGFAARSSNGALGVGVSQRFQGLTSEQAVQLCCALPQLHVMLWQLHPPAALVISPPSAAIQAAGDSVGQLSFPLDPQELLVSADMQWSTEGLGLHTCGCPSHTTGTALLHPLHKWQLCSKPGYTSHCALNAHTLCSMCTSGGGLPCSAAFPPHLTLGPHAGLTGTFESSYGGARSSTVLAESGGLCKGTC